MSASGIGDLTRTKKKCPTNPFPEGQKLINKVHKLAAYFSYGDRWDKLVERGKKELPHDIPTARLRLDLNTTRVSARWNLLYSCIRQHKLLRLHEATKNPAEKMSDGDWESAAQVEACMFLSQPASKLTQTEKHPVKAYRGIIFQELLQNLRDPSLPVIKMADVGVEPNLPRHDVEEANLSYIGKECKRRCLLEAERRFAGNTTEELTHADVEMDSSDELAQLLDPRINNCKHLIARADCADRIGKMRNNLKDEYVRWGMRVRELQMKDQPEEQDETDDANISSTEPTVSQQLKAVDSVAPGLFEGLGDDSENEVEDKQPEPEQTRQAHDKESRQHEADKLARAQLELDFNKHFKHYIKTSATIDWKTVPGVKVPPDRELIWKDLWTADMAFVMKKYFFKPEDSASKFGHLPKMALASKGMMASLMASSFCERINSCANIVVTKDNSLLSDEEIDKVVTLRMNRDFMEYMRTYYPEVIKSVHPKYGTVINADDVRQQREKEDAEPEADLFRG